MEGQLQEPFSSHGRLGWMEEGCQCCGRAVEWQLTTAQRSSVLHLDPFTFYNPASAARSGIWTTVQCSSVLVA